MARQADNAGGHPVDMALSVADTNAALHGLVAVLAALHLRHASGLGQHIDMAMIDATMVTDDHLHVALDDAYQTKNMPSEVWQSAAGPIVIAGDFRYLWRQLNSVLQVADPTPDDATLEQKIAARRAAVRQFLEHSCSDRAAVIDAMDRANLAWGDVRHSRQALEQPTVRHRGTITEVDDRGGARRRVTQSPYRFSAAASGVRGGAPHQGEHNHQVLADWLGPEVACEERWQRALVVAAAEEP
jgi:crotonobetainyl-CoA:carnitine CoA-transferase CaiB-like acyl-CoA transferase